MIGIGDEAILVDPVTENRKIVGDRQAEILGENIGPRLGLVGKLVTNGDRVPVGIEGSDGCRKSVSGSGGIAQIRRGQRARHLGRQIDGAVGDVSIHH